jgi:hypothetical protein
VNTTSPPILIFSDMNDNLQIQVRTTCDGVQMTEREIGDLFESRPATVSHHLREIQKEGVLLQESSRRVRKTGQKEVQGGSYRMATRYSLPVVSAVSHRVRSASSSCFQRWASSVVTTFACRGVVLDALFKTVSARPCAAVGWRPRSPRGRSDGGLQAPMRRDLRRVPPCDAPGKG